MNGIDIAKKRLTAEEKHLIKTFISEKFKGKTMLEGYIWFARQAKVSVSSLQKALRKYNPLKPKRDQLSEQIIDKIIKAL